MSQEMDGIARPEADGIARPEARRQKCDTLNEWAKTRCSHDTLHGTVESAINGVAYKMFDRLRGGADITNDELAKKLAKPLLEFANRGIDTDDVECAGRSVHAIFLKYVASKRGLPPEWRISLLRDWKKVWTKTLETMGERGAAFDVVIFNPDDPGNDACAPDELRRLGDENDACGCVVS